MSLVKSKNVFPSPKFKRKIKKLRPARKAHLDEQIRTLMKMPESGILKRGGLSHVRVHYFRFPKDREDTLLAYIYDNGKITLLLLDFATHENFYRDLNKHPNIR